MNSFFSLEDILADCALIPCKTENEWEELGWLDPGRKENLPKGKHIKLPLWLARELHQRRFLTMRTPPYLSSKSRDTLAASACKVNLGDIDGDFYESCMRIIPFIRHKRLCRKVVKDAFVLRRAVLQPYRHATQTRVLTRSERQLLMRAAKGQQMWQQLHKGI